MILAGDCVELMAAMPDASVDAVVTDPPYGLGFMGKDWDSPGGTGDFPMRRTDAANTVNTGNSRQGGRQRTTIDWQRRQSRDARSFQAWCEAWATEALRVLKPGGHLLAFGGTRTYHRLACAVEDAGFEIRDTLCWLYGQGFPKSRDVSKAIDKAAGVERDVVGSERVRDIRNGQGRGYGEGIDAGERGEPVYMERDLTVPATPEAERWQGWGTALKPAHEPIVVARKPLGGTVAANVLEHGTGALNVDGCRVGDTVETWPASRSYSSGNMALSGNLAEGANSVTQETGDTPPGRWPANVVLDEEAAAMLDEQTGELTSAGGRGPGPIMRREMSSRGLPGGGYGQGGASPELREPSGFTHSFGDSGGASRFFLSVKGDMLCALCGLPCAEAAANPSLPSAPANSSALSGVRDVPPLAPVVSRQGNSTSASTAAASSSITSAIPAAAGRDDSARRDATERLADWIVQLASSVGPLCKNCATSTAQSVALWLTDPTQASEAGAASTLEHALQTLSRNLALIAAGSRVTGITPTTADLSTSFGSAFHAIDATTRASSSVPDRVRFRYQSKSSTAERNAGLEGSSCVCGTVKPWDEQEDPEASPPRDTSALTERDGSDSSTSGNGSRKTAPSQKDCSSTTETVSRPTIGSPISNSSPPPSTSASTPRISADQAPVGSGDAASAIGGSPQPASTTTSAEKDGFSTDAAALAISGESSATSNADVCPDCGGVSKGARNSHPT